EVRLAVEVLHLARELGRVPRGVEPRDGCRRGMAVQQPVPGGLQRQPERADGTHAGDDDATPTHAGGLPPSLKDDLRSRELRLDVMNGIPDGLDLLSVLVRNVDLELVLELHHELDRVEGVRTEIVDERRVPGHFVPARPELLAHDVEDSLLYILNF